MTSGFTRGMALCLQALHRSGRTNYCRAVNADDVVEVEIKSFARSSKHRASVRAHLGPARREVCIEVCASAMPGGGSYMWLSLPSVWEALGCNTYAKDRNEMWSRWVSFADKFDLGQHALWKACPWESSSSSATDLESPFAAAMVSTHALLFTVARVLLAPQTEWLCGENSRSIDRAILGFLESLPSDFEGFKVFDGEATWTPP